MLGLAEYRAASADLLQQAQRTEQDIQAKISNDASASQAKSIAWSEMRKYANYNRQVLDQAMKDVAHNAVQHYANLLGVEADPELEDQLAQKQYTDKYYGLSLNQRLLYNERRLQGRITKSVYVNPKHAGDVLTKSFPFGAHYSVDKRTLLGTLVKVENDAARAMAVKANVPLIRWTMSHQHSQPDECDTLAGNIDKRVVDYLSQNDLDIDPAGVYFVEDLPHPPHPNCQCEYAMVTSQGEEHKGTIQRAFNTVLSVLRRLRQR